jgi:hypothetical protein
MLLKELVERRLAAVEVLSIMSAIDWLFVPVR